MDRNILPGEPLPDTRFAWLENGELMSATGRELFRRKRVIIVGVPGAFTPVCSRTHVPQFVEQAPALLRSGFDGIFVVARNDPWSLDIWAQGLDPERRLTFLSDGNLSFARKTRLLAQAPEFFLGDCLQRFVMIARDLQVERISVERSMGEVTCTAARTLQMAA
ncbi:MAG: redoxin family protein [Proteobacteria bacterium]|nr:redoxin family protein [Pseudomonadota bacterium]